MNRLLALSVLAVSTLGTVSQSHASLLVYVAHLDGPSESPPVASPGTGFARVKIDLVAHTLTVEATFSGLVGTTTVAHIHAPTAVPGMGNIGVATMTPTFLGFPAGVTSGTYGPVVFDTTDAASFNASFVTANGGTAAGAEAALAASLAAGTAYFNIHSTFAPGGEIRGFLQQEVPEPTSLAIWGLVALGLIGFSRQRSKNRG